MRQNQKQVHAQTNSLNKFLCSNIDKTFPDLVQRLRKNSQTSTNQTKFVATMRQYEKKFYTDQIKLLLSRVQKMSDKCKRQEATINFLKKELNATNAKKQIINNQIIQNQNQDVNVRKNQCQVDSQRYIAGRVKKHYLIQIDKIKMEYEKKLKEKERQKTNACKSLQFQLHCQMMQFKFQIDKFKKQKDTISNELMQSKQKITELELMIGNKDIQIDGIQELQSYREQNALLRSFIYKVQLAEQKLQKMEQTIKKQRQQFVQFAEETQSQKRQLLKDIETLKNNYEEKIKQLNFKYEQNIKQKQETIKNLQLIIQSFKALKQQAKAAQLHKQHLSQSILRDEQKISRKINASHSMKNSEINWQKMQASLHAATNKKHQKHQKIQILSMQLQNYKQKQIQYYREIERLRIQRNHIALENNKLVQQIAALEQQLVLVKRQYQQKQKAIKSRLSQFTIPQVQSYAQINSLNGSQVRLSQYNKIVQLQDRLEIQEQKNHELNKNYSQLQTYYKTKQNSMKLTLQMSQNSYKQLWQKYSLSQETHKYQINQAQIKIKQLQQQLQTQQLLHSQQQKQLLKSECLSLKQKLQCMKQQFQQIIKKKVEREENLQTQVYKQKQQLQLYQVDINNLNKKIEQSQELFVKIKNQLSQKLIRANDEFNQLRQRYNKENNEKQSSIYSLKSREQVLQKYIQQMQHTINSMRTQFDMSLLEKQQQIQKITNQLKKVTVQLKQFRNRNKKIYTLFDSNDSNIDYSCKSQHFHEQICQINANHQIQVDHLKQYIHELLQQNQELRQNYNMAAKSWRQMYDGMLKYNQFVDLSRNKMQSSTCRKRQIQAQLQSSQIRGQRIGRIYDKYQVVTKIIEQQQIVVKSNESDNKNIEINGPTNIVGDSQVFSVPNFSQRKQIQQITEQKEFMNQNFIRNLSKGLQFKQQSVNIQIKRQYHQQKQKIFYLQVDSITKNKQQNLDKQTHEENKGNNYEE